MSRIRARDTQPEIIVRRLLHAAGYRFRLHRRDLPGKPDLVFAGRRKVVLVHGCFWHRHNCQFGRVKPRTNAAFWEAKRNRNVERDRLVGEELRAGGWQIYIVWECEIKALEPLMRRLRRFLGPLDRPAC